MRKHTLTLTLMLAFLFTGCAQQPVKTTEPSNQPSTAVPIKEHLVLAALWQQHAAEYRALCHQAYNIATARLDWLLKNHSTDKPLAIIADIDETVLDNSPYASKLIREDVNYERESWFEWGRKESAEPVPGSLAFFQYAAKQGVAVFYVSNRMHSQLTETINNLQKHGFPQAQVSNVMLRSAESGKEARRQEIMKDHEVVMLLGDNLSDFNHAFDDQSTLKRNALVEQLRERFGSEYIVFPNPTYGDWETDGLYEGKHDWTEAEKAAIRRDKLKPD